MVSIFPTLYVIPCQNISFVLIVSFQKPKILWLFLALPLQEPLQGSYFLHRSVWITPAGRHSNLHHHLEINAKLKLFKFNIVSPPTPFSLHTLSQVTKWNFLPLSVEFPHKKLLRNLSIFCLAHRGMMK